jgi:hypothetical protein
MPDYQQRERKSRRIALPQLTNEEWAAWDRVVRETFARDEEWAVRFSMGHLIRCWASVDPSGAYGRVTSESAMDAIHRRNLKRAQYEQMFRTWGDIITNIDDVGDITSAASLLGEVTTYLDTLPTQAEKRLLVLAAHHSPFWSLITLLAGHVAADPDTVDPPYVNQAYRWVDAWESLRRGLDIAGEKQ